MTHFMKKTTNTALAVLLLGSLCAFAKEEPVTLSGETSRPEMSTFIPGEPVELTFRATGLPAGAGGSRVKIRIEDEHKKTVHEEEVPLGADGTVKVTAPSERFGFYRVFATLSNGVALEKLGSRAAGYLTYCVVPDPAQRKLYPAKETRFGMQGGFNRAINILPYLGIRWVVGGLSWGRMEPKYAGEFVEQRTAAQKEGKQFPPLNGFDWARVTVNGREEPWQTYPILVPFNGPAQWAKLDPGDKLATAPLSSEGEKAWRKYCLAAGRAQAQDHPEMDEHLYQITWEPMYPWGFKGTDEQLIRIYEIAYPALHEADSKAVVIGPTCSGLGGEASRWHARLFAKGLGKYLDGVSIHPYKTAAPEMGGYVEDLRQLKEIARQATGKDLPFFGTEQGFPTKEDPSMELEQARGLMRANLILLGEGYRLNVTFYIADYSWEPGFGYYYNLNPKIPGCGTDKIGPKPIAPAYAAQSFLLEGSSTAGPIEWLGATALGYSFELKDSVILALWDFGDKPRDVSLQVGVKEVEVYDWMGNRRTVATNDGNLQLVLTPEPQYIKGVSAALWGKSAKRPLAFSESRLKSFPGATASIKGKVAATLGALKPGKLVVEPDERLGVPKMEKTISLKSGRQEAFEIPLAIPANAPLGSYPIKFTLSDATGAIAGGGLMLALSSPLEIAPEPAFTKDGQPALNIGLTARQKESLSGTLQVSLRGVPGSAQNATFKKLTKDPQTVSVVFKDAELSPARVYSAIVAVQTTSGVKFEQELPVNFWSAAHRTCPPTKDGDLAGWKGVSPVELKGRDWVIRSREYYNGSDDLSATLRYAWDEHALYVACEVSDDVFYQPFTGFLTWRADSIQMAFDLDRGKTFETTGNTLADTSVQRRACEITLALTPEGPQAFRATTFNPDQFPVGLIPADKMPLTITKNEKGLVYEVAIPWTTLGATSPPLAGNVIGIAATINDADDDKQLDPTALGVFGGIFPTKNPAQFGSLILGTTK